MGKSTPDKAVSDRQPRTTLYGDAPTERVAASLEPAPLAEPSNAPVRDAGLVAPPRLVRPGFLRDAAS